MGTDRGSECHHYLHNKRLGWGYNEQIFLQTNDLASVINDSTEQDNDLEVLL